jgi:hypothetical protein
MQQKDLVRGLKSWHWSHMLPCAQQLFVTYMYSCMSQLVAAASYLLLPRHAVDWNMMWTWVTKTTGGSLEFYM